MRIPSLSRAPRSQPTARTETDARGWRNPLATSAVGAAVTVLVTAVVGGGVAWLGGDEESGSVAPDTPPFAVLVTDKSATCAEFAIDRAPDAVPPLPRSSAEHDAWASQLGGRPTRTVVLRVTVQGTTSDVVLLQSLTASVVPALPMTSGAIYGANCPDPILVPVREFTTELDPTTSTVRLQPREGAKFPFQISATEPEAFRIRVNPGGCDCDWTLQLAWTSGERSGTVTIDDDGKPFQSASSRGRTHYVYFWDAQRWIRF